MRYTYQDRIISIAKNCKNNIEFYQKLDLILDEILNEDVQLISTKKVWVYYSTWRVTLNVNEYRFGNEFAKKLSKLYFITHDEEKEYSVMDFKEMIDDCLSEYAEQFYEK